MDIEQEKSRSPLTRMPREKMGELHFKQIIRDLGLKVTHQRMAILQKLLAGRDHVTAQEVFETVSDTHPDIGFATVYRFLRDLTSHGFVTEVRMKGLPARYEWADKKHHDHLTCVDCGQIQEFENDEIETLQSKIAETMGFVLTDHILELYGVCPNCQKKKRTENGEPVLPFKSRK